MNRALRVTFAALLISGAARLAAAQPAAMPEEPATPARLQFGPLSIRPALILREVGFDSNVFNENDESEGDFTATFGARADLGIRTSRILGAYSSFYEYLYFQTFESERGANRGTEGRVDFLLGRVRPYILGGISNSHDRPSAEIDARALRQQTSVGGGVAVAAFSRTALFAGYRRNSVGYDRDEAFRGVRLADELNGHTGTGTFGADLELSPLTTVSAHGEWMAERFELSPDRDADSHRYGVTATLNPLALVSGKATVGVRAFRPGNPVVPSFTGITAAIAVGYAFHDESRLGLTIDRDLRHSFAESTPYFISTGARLTFTQRLVRNIDAQLVGGFDRIAYEARLDGISEDQRDRLRTVGGGVGVRVNDSSRLAINYEHTKRTSPVELREYSRGRLFAALTYGF